ncbi:hypothetical protein YDYSG_54770 [Paenibacillus tyrfis]|uniref:hypothetical protein n=1 Tax=Paenibacillus tyrfis TaxID=1501230 RepID=UPI002492F80A|nr:hypothetical protein [Paenibacillus tyrfis]GLI09445.1 hypothetical protein YDYSG_54770 [Paenibacillus tyrfis]
MKLHFIKKEINLSAKSYTVFIPNFPTDNMFALEHRCGIYMLFGDQKSLQYLACLFLAASIHRDKMIYVPVTTRLLPKDLQHFSAYNKNLDMVFMHHSIQFNTKLWKEIKQRMFRTKGELKSFECNPRQFSDLGYEDYCPFTYAENKDKILIKKYADTLFFYGSKKAFEFASGGLEPLSRTGASYFIRNGGHDHDHLDLFTPKHQGLCVDFYDEALWSKLQDERQ